MASVKIWPQVRNPVRHVDGSITSEVQYFEGGEWFNHSSAADAEDSRNVDLYNRINSGEFGEVTPLTDKVKAEYIRGINFSEQQLMFEDAVAVVRSLDDLEVMGLLDDEGKAKKEAWKAYGKDLREVDITVENPEWPEQPEGPYEKSV